MYLANRARIWSSVFAALAMISIAPTASAQDIAASHLKAAHEAIDALTATRQYDDILPQAAQALKQELIQKNPDLGQTITQLVDQETLAIAPRRGDLEREAATIYAKIFTEQQLKEMTEFYRSDTGKKLLEDGGLVARQVHEAAGIWQRGVARDLAQTVGTKLDELTAASDVTPASDEEEAAEQADQ